ncbi:MAG: DUF4124 domain-containing protein [Gammaproteobacteria bacterium]|nr:DUF4124 domain-containing protein [Gammaproteobacteria bacterium]
MNLSNVFKILLMTGILVTQLPAISYAKEQPKIYKWVDENGKVHYSDKPVNDKAETVNIDTKQPDPQSQQKAQQRAIQQKEKALTQLDGEAGKKRVQQRQEQKQKKVEQDCAKAREGLATLQEQVRIYSYDDNGKPVFMSDEERAEEIKRLKIGIKENCE